MFPSRSNIDPNAASQMRVALSRIVLNTGFSSPGELEITCNTSEIAVCCSSASDSSRLQASSCCSRSARGLRFRRARFLAMVPVERRRPPGVRLFTPLRDKVTSSAPLVPSGRPSPGSSPSILSEPHDKHPHLHSARRPRSGQRPSGVDDSLRLLSSIRVTSIRRRRSRGFDPRQGASSFAPRVGSGTPPVLSEGSQRCPAGGASFFRCVKYLTHGHGTTR
jgi:hypothetical protein